MHYEINPEYYRTFVAIAKYGSISAASAVLQNSQPNLTRSMKNLESLLGCTLLNRSNRGVTLTPEGAKLYERLKVAFEQIELGERELESAKQLECGVLNLSVTEVALRCFLLPVIKEFHLHYPGVRIQIGNQLTAPAIESVKTGRVDFAIVTVPENIELAPYEKEGLSFTLLDTIEEVCICSTESELSRVSALDVTEMERLPLISLSENTVTAQSFKRFFAQYACPFKPQFEAATADQILPLVKANLGVGFVPKDFIEGERDVCVLPLNQEIPRRNICVVTQKDKELSVAAKSFLNCK